ncbi:ARMT1-like domain-containing protein [Marispirochaeta sp.]|jgi:damage-control phosphatase, subfamily I|uniref:damage-control phosphatase ARMT1 family protein n=1 Tax=Marispirochaeta sp. TaxID=2038653 RepID=UPI0029C89071|nr:ARMT1-like domain-containing protein [Marispirochaeta sp.]
MNTYLDCIPCFFSQALFAARQAGCNEQQQKQVLDEISRLVPQLSMNASPPENAVPIYRIINRISGSTDPFAEIKEQSNKAAQSVYPDLVRRVESASDPLLTAVEIAISGNIIDYGANRDIDLKEEIENILDQEDKAVHRESRELFDIESLRAGLAAARELVYIGDNAGEIVFDKILVSAITKFYPEIRILYAVRGKPIINDVTLADARTTGMDKLCEVVSSGSPAPGAVPDFVSPEFNELLNKADIIISKGQGNYEALSGSGLPILFLLRVKCDIIARHIPAELGDFCLIK